jgi:hypothetical protein
MGTDLWLSLAQAALDGITLFFLLVGLAGLLIPIFPGLTIMWLGTVFYATVRLTSGQMTSLEWLAFALITILMVVGNVVDNIIISRKMRERAIPWKSILMGYAAGVVGSLLFTPLVGLLTAPAGLYAAESVRLRSGREAMASTRAWLTGWGWSFAARLAIGLLMTMTWMLWAWL